MDEQAELETPASAPFSPTLDKQKVNSPILNRPIIIGDLTLGSPTTQTTIGANGAASALTANPVGYLTVMVGNTAVQIPYYNLA